MFALALLVAFTTAWFEAKPYRGESDNTKFYVTINEGTCESLGFVDVTKTADCQDALNSSPDPTFNNKYKEKVRSSKRTKGCVYSHKTKAAYIVSEKSSNYNGCPDGYERGTQRNICTLNPALAEFQMFYECDEWCAVSPWDNAYYLNGQSICGKWTEIYEKQTCPAPADREEASEKYQYFCLYDQAASLMTSPQHTVDQEGWFCAHYKQLPTATGADECMAATLADGECGWTLDLTKQFYIYGSGLCACGTDDCRSRYKQAGKTIYETSDVTPVDCKASGEADKNECGKDCDYVDNITTKRKGLGGICDWDDVKEESCEDGDGACVDDEASSLAFADMDATDAGVLFFAMIGAGSLVYGTYQFFVRKTLYSEISESSPLDV